MLDLSIFNSQALCELIIKRAKFFIVYVPTILFLDENSYQKNIITLTLKTLQ